MSPEVFLILMGKLEKIISSPAGTRDLMKNFTVPKVPEGSNERPDRSVRIHLSDTWIGKDDNGIIWISVVAENRPKIKFEFRISDFHKLFHGNGTALTEAEASELQARAWVRGVTMAMQSQFATLRDPIPRDENGGKRGNRYGQNNQTRPQQTSKPSAVEFEDLTY
jgi:hypothetical protein